MFNFEFLKTIPRNVWVVLGIAVFLVAFASYNWGKATGLEECKA